MNQETEKQCENRLLVIGPTEQLVEFRERVHDADLALSFNAIRPEPEGLRGVQAESPLDIDPDAVRSGLRPARSSPEWRLARWGCEGQGPTELSEDNPEGQRLTYEILTSRRSPDALLEFASERFPGLVLDNSWSVTGGAAGRDRFQGGQHEKV